MPLLFAPTSITPVREKNGAQAIGRSRGGLTTKIHALVDALGNPVALMLTPGQAHDLTCAESLLEGANPDALLGDKAYDGDSLIDTLAQRGITGVIPLWARVSINESPSYALSPSKASGLAPSSKDSAQVRSWACPGVSISATGLPKASTRAWILVVSPPRDRPIACSPSFFAPRRYVGARGQWWHRSSCIRCRDRSPIA